MKSKDSILSKPEKGTSTKPLIGIDFFDVPFSMLNGTLVTGVSVPYSGEGVQLNFGAVTNHGFIHGIVDPNRAKFYPGRILSDNTGAASFIPGLNFKDRFVPGAARGTLFVPGVYYMGAFIPGIYRDDVFVPGTIKPDGFDELPDSSDIGIMLMYGNPFNWDLSEDHLPNQPPPDLMRPETDKTWEESAKEEITTRILLPVGYGDGTKPPPGTQEGVVLPGHSLNLQEERARDKIEALDFDGDGKPNFGWRIRDPRISPVEPGESEIFSFDRFEKDDAGFIGGSVGIGMGPEGGRIGGIPKLTGDPAEDAKRILGGIDPNKRNRVFLGDPGPESNRLLMQILIGLNVGMGIEVFKLILELYFLPPVPEPEPPPE